MDAERRRKLRGQYRRSQAIVDDALDGASCGLAVLRYISPSVEEACRMLDSIEAEVEQAMADERVNQGGSS